MSRWPDLPPGNRFEAILRVAAEMRAAQRGRMLTAQLMRAARAEAQRRARSDLLHVTAYRPAQTREAGAGGTIARDDVAT